MIEDGIPVREIDIGDWPNQQASRYVEAGALRWHVQQMGSGPVLLLLHGTGAATHSWRALAPLLAKHFTVVAPDLPGHGFTGTPSSSQLSLPGMAQSIGALVRELGCEPSLAVGHSAGAAILLRMCLDGDIAPRGLISLNGALLPFRGVAGPLFSQIAKLLVWNPVAPRLVTWRAANRANVTRLLRGTGSDIDAAGIDQYKRLFQDPDHVAATLRMMANWDLRPLESELSDLALPLLLAVGSEDRAVPPGDTHYLRRRIKTADVHRLEGLGHLAHEERPDLVADLVATYARRVGALPDV